MNSQIFYKFSIYDKFSMFLYEIPFFVKNKLANFAAIIYSKLKSVYEKIFIIHFHY